MWVVELVLSRPSAKMWPWDGRHSSSGVTTSLASNRSLAECVNDVWSVRVNGHLAVGRLGRRATLISRGRPSSCNTSTVKV